jgi:hypothetical protein
MKAPELDKEWNTNFYCLHFSLLEVWLSLAV